MQTKGGSLVALSTLAQQFAKKKTNKQTQQLSCLLNKTKQKQQFHSELFSLFIMYGRELSLVLYEC